MTAPPDVYSKFQEGYDLLWAHWGHTTATAQPKSERREILIGEQRVVVRFDRQRPITEYVPMFFERTQRGTKMLPAIGIGLGAPSENSGSTEEFDFGFGDELDGAAPQLGLIQSKGPVASRYATDVFELRMPAGTVVERISGIRGRPASAREALVGALLSFSAGLAVSSFNLLEAELGDFSTSWKLHASGETASVFLFDVSEGGNGIARQVYEQWVAEPVGGDLLGQVRNVLGSTCCERYCDLCILLPRTPEVWLRRGLLDKRLGRSLLSA